ncbi:PREDICTED: uncharacterized protein LOC101292882 [Fragaria vesca subsp. vesca]
MDQRRTLELQLVSAKDLKNCILLTKMDVYAVVSVDGEPTTASKVGQPHSSETAALTPRSTSSFASPSTTLYVLTQHNCLSIEIELIDVVHITLKVLLDSADPKKMKLISRRLRGRQNGEPSCSRTSSPCRSRS